jgi:hypothetical protein
MWRGAIEQLRLSSHCTVRSPAPDSAPKRSGLAHAAAAMEG